MSTGTDSHEAGNHFAGHVKQVEDPLMKALRIKVSGLKRNIKDLEFAKKEVVREVARLETTKESDPDRVKQQECVVSEAQMMIPLSENRVRAAIKDLNDFLVEENIDDKENELVKGAHLALEEGALALSQA